MKNRLYLIAAVILLLPCSLKAQWSVDFSEEPAATSIPRTSIT